MSDTTTTTQNNTRKYDQKLRGWGYLNQMRDVIGKPGARKFNPFIAVRIGALEGIVDENNPRANSFLVDTRVSGKNAQVIIKHLMGIVAAVKAEDPSKTSVNIYAEYVVGVTGSKVYPAKNRDTQEDEYRSCIEGRLVTIKRVYVEGEEVAIASIPGVDLSQYQNDANKANDPENAQSEMPAEEMKAAANE